MKRMIFLVTRCPLNSPALQGMWIFILSRFLLLTTMMRWTQTNPSHLLLRSLMMKMQTNSTFQGHKFLLMLFWQRPLVSNTFITCGPYTKRMWQQNAQFLSILVETFNVQTFLNLSIHSLLNNSVPWTYHLTTFHPLFNHHPCLHCHCHHSHPIFQHSGAR